LLLRRSLRHGELNTRHVIYAEFDAAGYHALRGEYLLLARAEKMLPPFAAFTARHTTRAAMTCRLTERARCCDKITVRERAIG